jgi:MoxR-like ATPase
MNIDMRLQKEEGRTDYIKKVTDLSQRILTEVSKVIIGKEEQKRLMLIALLAGGHMLIEGLPGTAKTKLARTFAGVIGGQFKRIQFTPDMLPADVTGFYLYSPDGSSRLIDGPIFTNMLLADELNRATPRTQSALLEAMQEYQVTIERETHRLSKPFMVIATQQEFGAEGTYPLTNVQIDRFLLRSLSLYTPKEEEEEVIANIDRIEEPQISSVTCLEEINEAREAVKRIHVSREIVDYITTLVQALRTDPDVELGPSVRAGIALYKCGRAVALLDGRDFVIPDDIKHLALPGIEQRIRIRPEAEMDGITARIVLERTIENTPVPKLSV